MTVDTLPTQHMSKLLLYKVSEPVTRANWRCICMPDNIIVYILFWISFLIITPYDQHAHSHSIKQVIKWSCILIKHTFLSYLLPFHSALLQSGIGTDCNCSVLQRPILILRQQPVIYPYLTFVYRSWLSEFWHSLSFLIIWNESNILLTTGR